MNIYPQTKHAVIQSQRRGIADAVQTLIYEQGDLIYRAHGNAELLGLSDGQLQELRATGIPAKILERAKSVFLVIGPNGQILTVQHQLRPYRNLA